MFDQIPLHLTQLEIGWGTNSQLTNPQSETSIRIVLEARVELGNWPELVRSEAASKMVTSIFSGRSDGPVPRLESS
jgi:hypothetical protein